MSHTILWPTDLSETSYKALPQVMSLAEKFGSRVVVLYVGTDLCALFPAYGNYPSPEIVERFQDWELERARKHLQELCAGALKGCPNLDIRLMRGDPAEKILETAEAEAADLIVLARRGHGSDAASASDFGRVAERVVKNATVGVVVVKP